MASPVAPMATCTLPGRGLVIAPSYFLVTPVVHLSLLAGKPAVLLNPTMPAAAGRGRSSADLIRANQAVERLVGRTRASELPDAADRSGARPRQHGDAAGRRAAVGDRTEHCPRYEADRHLSAWSARVDHLITSLGRGLLRQS
jgi:hypothetical protein